MPVAERAASHTSSLQEATPPKRILVLFSEVFADGGIQRFNKTLLAACERLPLVCDVLCLADTEESVPPHDVASRANVRAFGRDKLRFVWAVARAILSGRYDAVLIGHIHMLSMVTAIMALRAFRGPQTLLITHGTEVWTGVRGLRRRALASVDRILCVSDFTREMIHRQAPELIGERFALFPNALSETWIACQTASESSPVAGGAPELPPRFILSVARLSRHDRTKGIVAVIEALGMLEDRDLHYVIAGRATTWTSCVRPRHA